MEIIGAYFSSLTPFNIVPIVMDHSSSIDLQKLKCIELKKRWPNQKKKYVFSERILNLYCTCIAEIL